MLLEFSLGSTCLAISSHMSNVTNIDIKSHIEEYETFKLNFNGEEICEPKAQVDSNQISETEAYKFDNSIFVQSIYRSINKEKDCKYTEGKIQSILDFYAELEADDKIPNKLIAESAAILINSYTEAVSLKLKLNSILKQNIEPDLKKKIILSFIKNVFLPISEVNYILSLLTGKKLFRGIGLSPEIPSTLFEGTNELSSLLSQDGFSYGQGVIELSSFDTYIVASYNEKEGLGSILKILSKFSYPKIYLAALRVISVQMAINQITNTHILSNEKENFIEVPRSCTENLKNGMAESRIEIEVPKNVRDGLRVGLLNNLGFLYNPYSLESYQQSIGSTSITDLNDESAYGRSLEYENYRNLKKAVYDNYLENNLSLKPHMSDQVFFPIFRDEALSLIQGMSVSQRSQSVRDIRKNKNKNKNKNKRLSIRRDFSLYQSIFAPVKEGDVALVVNAKTGEEREVDFSTLNASEFLKERMIQEGVFYPEDLLSESQVKELKSLHLKISMPSLYGPSPSINIALRLLRNGIENQQSKGITSIEYSDCRGLRSRLCHGRRVQFNRALEFIDTLKQDDHFFPNAKIEHAVIEKKYLILAEIWKQIQDEEIPQSTINAYEYLKTQLILQNKVAMTKLGFLVAENDLNQLEHDFSSTKIAKRAKMRVYTRKGIRLDQVKSFFYDVKMKIGMESSFAPRFTSSIPNEIQKIVYQKKIDEVDTNSSFLLKSHTDGIDTFSNLSKLNSKLSLNEASVREAIATHLEFGLSDELEDKMRVKLNSTNVEKMNLFLDLSKIKDHKQRISLFDEYMEKHGFIDNVDLKEEILITDSSLKEPLYEEVIIQSAKRKKAQLLDQLDYICNLDLEFHEKLKEFFYSTLKSQSHFNQLAGGVAVPQEFMDRIESATFEENMNMLKGIGAFVVGVGALALIGACGASAGTLCGPAIYIGSLAGGILGVSSFKSEIEIKLRSDESVNEISKMEALGMTDINAHASLETSWVWATLASLDVIPLIGIVGRGVSMGSRLTRQNISIALSMKKNKQHFSHIDYKQASQTVLMQEEVRLAKVVLGMNEKSGIFNMGKLNWSPDELLDLAISSDSEKFILKTKELNQKYLSGKMTLTQYEKISLDMAYQLKTLMKKNGDFYKLFTNEGVYMSVEELNQQAAKTLTHFFSSSPQKVKAFVANFKRKNEVKNLFGRRKGALNRKKFLEAQTGKLPFLRNLINVPFYENKYYLSKRNITLKKLLNNISQVSSESELKAFFLENIDEFTSIFSSAPLRKSDIPYLFFQGSGVTADKVFRSIPLVNKMGEGLLVRKICQARMRLVGERVKAEARLELDLPSVIRSEKFSTLFSSFNKTSLEFIQSQPLQKQSRLLTQLEFANNSFFKEFERIIKTDAEVSKLVGNYTELSDAAIKKLFYEASRVEDINIRDLVWSRVNVDNVFFQANKTPYGIKQLDKRMLKDSFKFIISSGLSSSLKDSSIVGVQRYLALLKVLSFEKKLGNVELF